MRSFSAHTVTELEQMVSTRISLITVRVSVLLYTLIRLLLGNLIPRSRYRSVVSQLKNRFVHNKDIPENIHKDINRYLNQGGLLGFFTYLMIYLKTNDKDISDTAASIPVTLFVTSSLHDDAIDEASTHDENLKEFLNYKITIGDLAFAHTLECVDQLPDKFDIQSITSQIGKIGSGQLKEENDSLQDISADQAIERVEERGSVWGELAISPVDAGGYYTDEQLEKANRLCANLLFFYTVVDDVEDIPEDFENNVLNTPLLLFNESINEYDSKQSLIDEFLGSDVPEVLDELCSAKKREIDTVAREFSEDSEYSKEAILAACDQALDWYQNAVCTVPVEESVSKERQEEIYAILESDNERDQRRLLEEVMANLPMQAQAQSDLRSTMNTFSVGQIAPTIVMLSHVKKLVESVMTTNLEDALEQLQTVSEDS